MFGGVVVGSDLSGIRYGGPKMELDNSINGTSDALVAIFKNSLSFLGVRPTSMAVRRSSLAFLPLSKSL